MINNAVAHVSRKCRSLLIPSILLEVSNSFQFVFFFFLTRFPRCSSKVFETRKIFLKYFVAKDSFRSCLFRACFAIRNQSTVYWPGMNIQRRFLARFASILPLSCRFPLPFDLMSRGATNDTHLRVA